MTCDDLEAVVSEMAATLGLTLEDDWRSGIAQQLAISLQMAQTVADVVLPDGFEARAIYHPDAT